MKNEDKTITIPHEFSLAVEYIGRALIHFLGYFIYSAMILIAWCFSKIDYEDFIGWTPTHYGNLMYAMGILFMFATFVLAGISFRDAKNYMELRELKNEKVESE